MRTLIACDAVGGTWSYAQELRAALGGEGVEAHIAVLGPEPPPDPTVAYMRCRLEWEEDPWEDVADSAAWLADLASELDADVVQLGSYAHAAAVEWPAPTVVVGHSCLLSWQAAVLGTNTSAASDRYRREVAAGLRAADAVVAPTAQMLASLRAHYRVSFDGRVIRNGVGAGPVPARERVPLVLGAGRVWDRAKGLEALASAASGLDWPVTIAGETGARRPTSGAAGSSCFTGAMPRERLRALMAKASIFAHPARYEPFGLAPLEAALGGCALVLGDIPTLRELWDGAAEFVRPGDARSLRAALRRLIAEEADRTRLAALARERAQRYGAATMARGYAALYELLVRAGRVAA